MQFVIRNIARSLFSRKHRGLNLENYTTEERRDIARRIREMSYTIKGL